MKKTAFILALLLSLPLAAQQERVTIHRNSASLSILIREVERQTPFLFGVDRGVKLSGRISLNVDDIPLQQVLDYAFADSDISYRFEGKHIFLSKRPAGAPAQGQNLSEASPGQKLAGAEAIEASRITDSLRREQKYYHENLFRAFGKQMQYDFSEEGRKNWKAEGMVSTHGGPFHGGYLGAVGIRLDESRVWGLGSGYDSYYVDANPSNYYMVPAYLWMKHYFPIGRRFSILTDVLAGAEFKVYDTLDHWDLKEAYGDRYFYTGPNARPFFLLRPGIDFRFTRYLHIFTGIYLYSVYGFGLYLGLTL